MNKFKSIVQSIYWAYRGASWGLLYFGKTHCGASRRTSKISRVFGSSSCSRGARRSYWTRDFLPASRNAAALAPKESINTELCQKSRSRSYDSGDDGKGRPGREKERPRRVQARNNGSVLGGFGRLRFPLQLASPRFSLRSHLSISPNEKLPGNRITF